MCKILIFLMSFAVLSIGGAAQAVEPLVDVEWLKENGQRPDVVILDVRSKIGGWDKEAYKQGHIPGAVYSDYLKGGWRRTVDGVIGQLPPVADLERMIGSLGIDNDSHVVIVAGGVSALDMGSATRVYWTFKVLGHDRVSILDGGHTAYVADPANRLETGWVSPQPRQFTASFRPEMIAGRAEVRAAMESGQTLLDIRPPKQYLGQAAHPAAKRKGTIPGAVNLPEGRLTENGGTFVGPDTVTALLAEAGVEGEGAQISFCNTGHWASLGWFASSEIAGNKDVKLYDGSMVDWTAHGDLPVEVKAVE